MLCLGRLLPKCRCSMATASTPPGQQLGAFDFQAPPPKLGAAFPVKGGYFRLVLQVGSSRCQFLSCPVLSLSLSLSLSSDLIS